MAIDPVTVGVIANIMGRLIDRKKKTSKTNLTTAAAVFTGTGAGFTFMLENADWKVQLMGTVLTLATLALAAYKEK